MTNPSNTDTRTESAPTCQGAAPAPPDDDRGLFTMTRRNAAMFFAGLAGTVSLGSFVVTAITGAESGTIVSKTHRNYKNFYVQGTKMVDQQGTQIGVDSIPAGSGKEMTVFPEKQGGGPLTDRNATTLLVRFDESDYKQPTDVEGTVKGYSAYSKVCTHEGCMVSERSGPDGTYFHCPCHQSTFDPLQGAEVVGGPAPRALPQLPIGLTSDGKFIIATGHFSGPIGPQ